MWMVGFMISMVTILKGLKHIGLDIDLGLGSKFANALPIAALMGLVVAAFGALLLRRIKEGPAGDNRFVDVERVFAILMIFTACSMAFAHGSNDVANAIGPVAAIVSTVSSGEIAAKSAIPWWILLIGGLGIVVGLATYGWKVIATVGRKITELTPSRGFAAELGAASTVVIASATGLPISTTHTLVGAVLGVGMARGIAALNLRVVSTIFMSWIITLPAGAGLAIVFFFIFKGIFG
jgi:PiT family inorganic phosphate transporter